MNYKLVIFDFDGTLADTFMWFAENVNKAAGKYKFKKVNLDDVKELRHFSAAEMLKRHEVKAWKLPAIANFMRKLMHAEIDNLVLFEGVEDVLLSLKNKDIKLALVTSNSHKNVSRVLGKQNIALFDYYVCGVSIFGKKRKLLKVIKQSGIEKNQTIYIGDEIRDGEAARAMGIHFGAVSWGYNDEKALQAQSPDVVFQTVDDIVHFIL